MQHAELKQVKPLSSKLLLLVLVAVCLVLYGNTLSNGYVLDDVAVVTKNAWVQEGGAGIPTLLHTPYLRGFKMPATDTAASNDLYRPVSLVTFAIEKELFDNSAGISHAINVLLYAACVCLLFVFLRRLLGDERTAIAFAAALLFAVHPVHTEVVANIKSRDELLCFLFAFAALILYLKYAENGKVWQLLTGAALYFLSLLSKESSVTFIAIVPLVFFLYSNCSKRRSAFIMAATAISFVVFMLLRQAVLTHYNANHDNIAFIDNPLIAAPGASRYATALLVMGKYLKLLLLPYPLCSDYTFNTIPFAGFADATVMLSLLGYVLMVAIAIYRLIKKRDAIALGLLFFLATLALFCNLVFFVGSMMAERFLFFPSVGSCLVAAALLAGPSHGKTLRLSKAATFLLVVVCLLYGSIATSRNTNWQSNMTLFNADLETAPGNARLWYSLGYEKAGEADIDKGRAAELMGEGIKDIQHSLSIYPGYANAHYTLSNLFIRAAQFDSALVHAQAAVQLSPTDATIISGLGYAYFVKGQYHESIGIARQALQYDPGNAAIWDNIAICYQQLKEPDSASAASHEASRLRR